MSAKDIAEEILHQEEEARNYLESQRAYDWLIRTIYANEEAGV